MGTFKIIEMHQAISVLSLQVRISRHQRDSVSDNPIHATNVVKYLATSTVEAGTSDLNTTISPTAVCAERCTNISAHCASIRSCAVHQTLEMAER